HQSEAVEGRYAAVMAPGASGRMSMRGMGMSYMEMPTMHVAKMQMAEATEEGEQAQHQADSKTDEIPVLRTEQKCMHGHLLSFVLRTPLLRSPPLPAPLSAALRVSAPAFAVECFRRGASSGRSTSSRRSASDGVSSIAASSRRQRRVSSCWAAASSAR